VFIFYNLSDLGGRICFKLLLFICFSQILISILAYAAGLFSCDYSFVTKVISWGMMLSIAAVCSGATYSFLVKIRQMHYKSSLARALLSMLSEADEIIILNDALQIVYAKHFSEQFLTKSFDFDFFIKSQFVDHEGAIARCQRAILEGAYFEDIFKTVKSSQQNSENYIWLRVLPLYAKDREAPSNMAIIMSDVTIHRSNIRDIDKQYVEIERYFRQAPLGIIYANSLGEIIWGNDTILRWLNRHKRSVIGRSLEDFVDFSTGNFSEFINFTEPVSVVIKVDDSSVMSAALHITRISEDRLLFLILKIDNLENLKSSKANAEAFSGNDYFKNTPIPSFHIKNDGEVVAMSNSAKYIFKDINAEVGINFFDILREQSKTQLNKAIISQDSTMQHFELQIADSDMSFSVYINRAERGNCFILQAVDMTEQKKLERQFAQAQKIQAVGQLAGGIAHDFNNLLTAIIGFCDLLLQRIMPNDISYADIMQIKQNANRASTLVKQLLAFSRRQSLQPRIINVKNTLTEISSLLRRLIGSQINLRVVHEKNLWAIKADVSQLEQVIINVVVNARDAMNGKGDITIEVANYTNAVQQTIGSDALLKGDYVMIKVSDTGCGIPKEIIPSLFDPFFSTKGIGQGTGLGLATVYGIIKQTGGAIDVESEVGEGATFKIFLPRCFEEEAALEQPSQVVTDITGTETIFLVEDEDAIRIFAGRALREKGYRVIEAANGEMALSLIDQGYIPDIVITDVSMPKVDGPTLQRILHEKMPNVPVIFTSGYAEETFRQNLSEDQSIHFLPKPFTIRELASKVREILQKNKKSNGE
jgi:two-component system cell cycle sensor histidine kinase/response regulator CckA